MGLKGPWPFAAGGLFAKAGTDQLQRRGEGCISVQISGVEQHGIRRRFHGGDYAGAIGSVARMDPGGDGGEVGGHAAGAQLGPAAAAAFLDAGSDEKLGGGVGEDDGADVTAVKHSAVGEAEATLEVEQGGADGGDGGDEAGGFVHWRAAQVGALSVVKVQVARCHCGSHGIGGAMTSLNYAASYGAVEQSGIEMRQP